VEAAHKLAHYLQVKQKRQRPKSRTPKPMILGEQSLNKSTERSHSVERKTSVSKTSFYTDKRRNTDQHQVTFDLPFKSTTPKKSSPSKENQF